MQCTERLKRLWKNPSLLLVGLTGGIASGKSTIAGMLEERGAYIIDFDRLSREIMEPGMPAFSEIIDALGKEILDHAGRLDRKKISGLVFDDSTIREKLEQITHPRIFDLFAYRAENLLKANSDKKILAAVVPLLFEKSLQFMFHRIVLVYTPAKMQLERLIQRDGISKKDAAKILSSQLPIDEKLDYSDFVINNEGAPGTAQKEVDTLWRILIRTQRQRSQRR